MNEKRSISIEGAQMIFRNFSGKEGTFNPEGKRNFCVLLDHDVAAQLKTDGWNIKELEPKEEGDIPQPFIKVTVNFNNRPPRIVLVGSKGKSVISEDEVGMLDWVEVENADIIIDPYDWTFNGRTGRTAYLKALYITIIEDEFESKYYDVPDSAAGSIGGCGNCEECDGSCKDHAS